MKIVKVNKNHKDKLKRFFESIDKKDKVFFEPHLLTAEMAKEIAYYKGRDVYYVIEDNSTIIAYGFLRGWDTHWNNICLGIIVKPSKRRKGYGELMCNVLHTIARQCEVGCIRLHVKPDNAVALNLYRKLGYVFESKRENGDWIGYKNLE